MAAKCERCGQTILPDDTVCWQCGARFLSTPGAATPPAEKDETGLPSISFAMVAYLAVATAVTLLLLIWAMFVLV